MTEEYRILANADEGAWGQRARIRLIETEAESGADSLRLATLEAGFAAFLATFAASGSDQLDQALLQLADARRLLAANGDLTRLAGAAEAGGALTATFGDASTDTFDVTGLALVAGAANAANSDVCTEPVTVSTRVALAAAVRTSRSEFTVMRWFFRRTTTNCSNSSFPK